MSDEATNETTEQTPEGDGDKAINFARLRQEKEALEQELAALRPLRVKETLRQAGFDPDAAEGKALALAVEAGRVEADPTQIAEYASSEFGFQPKAPLSESEATQVEGSRRVEQARQVSTSEENPDTADLIAEAEAKGEWGTAMGLKMQRMAERHTAGI